MPFIHYSGKNILFVHIPKTGGTSVTNWMGGFEPVQFHNPGKQSLLYVTPQHLRHSDLRALFAEGYFDYAFTIVRNPYDRIESEYRFRREVGLANDRPELPPFSMWLERALEMFGREHWHLDNHIRPQVDFLGSGVQVFRFEDGLRHILGEVASAVGLPKPKRVGHARASGPDADPIDWDLQDRLRVNRHYAEDFERFGYPVITD